LFLVVLVLPNIKRQKEGREFFDEEGNVKFSVKLLEQAFGQEFVTCLTSPTIFEILLKKCDNCKTDNFTANSEKNLLDLAANQLKWQNVTKSSSFSYTRLLVIMTQLYA